MLNFLERLFSRLPDGPKEKRYKAFIREQYEAEISIPPTIAIIGAAGVGKSSTINALFGTQLKVSNTVAGTIKPSKVSINAKRRRIQGGNGDLILYDMPGVDEDIDKEDEYLDYYINIISKCDVAVWIVSATDRRMAYDQNFVAKMLREIDTNLSSRLVFGVNKVDLVHPDNWNQRANLPSVEQEKNIDEILRYIYRKFERVCPDLNSNQVVAYSARQLFRLEDLFGAMLNACPEERAWVLNSRQYIANYWDLVQEDLKIQVEEYVGEVG